MKKAIVALLVPLVAACASGKGRVETMFDGINPVDALTVVGLGKLAYDVSGRSVWDAKTDPIGRNLYRVTMRRNRLADSGDGEVHVILRQQAEKIVVAQSCAGWRLVAFEEYYESKLIGSQRVAEGVIECVKA